MRASNIVAAVLSVAMVGGAILSLTHGLANASASSFESVCRNTQLSFATQTQCSQDIKAASTDTMRKQVAARYQNMIDTKSTTEQSIPVASPSGPGMPPAQENQSPSSPATPN
ncbi:MAG: hypothetical protein EPO08_19885 [Rhodospirillaceae bacterium]|nr:MAG: hypothetical protein EPO08_19885 [Rhodospirillaceae bacterium]